MANLLSIAEQAWRQLFPGPSDEVKVKKEEVIATAKTEYAYQLWVKLMVDKREEGIMEVPSYLYSEAELEIKDNVMDISSLKIMRSIPWETWLAQIGELDCECKYVKSTLNLSQVLCDDDSLPDSAKTYYVVGKKIKFPKGVHKTPLPIVYANSGENIDGNIEVEDSLAGIVRRTLIEIYGGKIGVTDKTNNSNPEN